MPTNVIPHKKAMTEDKMINFWHYTQFTYRINYVQKKLFIYIFQGIVNYFKGIG